MLTPNEEHEAREWLKDLEFVDWEGDHQEQYDSIDELPAVLVERAIDRHWDGGIRYFKLAINHPDPEV